MPRRAVKKLDGVADLSTTSPKDGVGSLEFGEFSDDDFLESVTATMSEDEQRDLSIIERIKSVYVECGRDQVLAATLRDFIKLVLAKRDGQRDEGGVFFVTGESGAGKSRAVEHMLSTNPALQPQVKSFGTIRPVISVSLSGPSTLKILGMQILRQAGYHLTQNIEQGVLWDLLPAQLHHRKVLMIHIDETQHMLKQTKTDTERVNLAKALKGVMNYKPWPISFIMSGMPETTNLSLLDEQFERRGRYLFLPDVNIDEEMVLVENILRRLSQAAGIDCEHIIASDIPERIAHAARYRYGRIAKFTIEGLMVALKRKSPALTREHFARAYMNLSHARGRDEMNPFLIEDWRILPPGNFLYQGSNG